MELRLQIKTIEKQLLAWHRTSQESTRLETIPGVGLITATAIAATVTDRYTFDRVGSFRATFVGWERSSWPRLEDGEPVFAFSHRRRSPAMIRYAREKSAVSARWINALLDKNPARLVSVAVANKMARIAWALLAKKEDYRIPVHVAA